MDQQIIELIRTGQHSTALKSLYENYDQVERMILSKGGSKDDAKDVFQEGLIVLCGKVSKPDFTLTAGIGTYLYSVCALVWKGMLQKRKVKVSLDQWPAVDEQQEQDVKWHMEQENRFKSIDQVLNNLGSVCKELLQKYYFQKLSMKMIAESMGYNSENTAKNQKYKCLERARKMAKERAGDLHQNIAL